MTSHLWKNGNTINWKWENKELARILQHRESYCCQYSVYFQKVSWWHLRLDKNSYLCIWEINDLDLEIIAETVLQVIKQYLLSK